MKKLNWETVLIIVGMVGSFWAYCEGHFAHADLMAEEIDSRKELKAEVDALYLRMIPEPEKAPLHHHEEMRRGP